MSPDAPNPASAAPADRANNPGASASTPSALAALASATMQHMVQSELTLRKEAAAWSLADLARMTRQTGNQLRANNQAPLAEQTEQVAGHMEQASAYLHRHGLEEIMQDVTLLAKQQPAVFIAGGVLLGFLAARFLKSSSDPAQPPSASA